MKKFTIFLVFMILVTAMTGCKEKGSVPELTWRDPSYQAMSRVKAEVLAISNVNIEENEILITDVTVPAGENDGFVTTVTVGFRFENEADAELVNLEKIQFTRADGEPLIGTSSHSFWYSEEGNYAIVTLRLIGKLAASDIKYTLYNTSGDITFENKLDDNIHTFDTYVNLSAADELSVIRKINGCHYITVDLWHSDTSVLETENGVKISDTFSYVLVPLEGDLTFTLDNANLDLSVKTEEELDDTIQLTAQISDGSGKDERYSHKYENAPAYQTLVHLTAETFVENQVYQSENFSEEIIRTVNRAALNASVLNVTDAEGNTQSFVY